MRISSMERMGRMESRGYKDKMNNRVISKNRAGGYLTVFLSLILTVMIAFCLLLINGVQENTAYMEAECITDIGMNCIFAEYHRELLNQYELLFIDTSYGTPYASYENTEAHLQAYLEKNTEKEDVFLDGMYRDILGLTVKNVSFTEVSCASDDGGKVLRRQAVDVMRQKIGVTHIEQVTDWVGTAEEYDLTTRDLLEDKKKIEDGLSEWNIALDEETMERVGLGNEVVSIWEAGILNFMAKREELSGSKILLDNYLTHREIQKGTGLSALLSYQETMEDELLFREYILEYTGHYHDEKENGLLKYQTEYIMIGTESDVENLKMVAKDILNIRGAANYVSFLQDDTKKLAAETLAKLIASMLGVPESEKLFRILIGLLWSMTEAVYDVTELLRDKEIPLIKEPEEWCFSVEGILSTYSLWKWIDAVEGDDLEGLSYGDYLRILLYFKDTEGITYRLMDLMEMDIRQTQGNALFRMDGCVDGVHAVVTYEDKNKKIYEIERSYCY